MKTLSHNILSQSVSRKVEFILFFFPLLFLPHIIFAQYENLEFENLTRDDGLTVSHITGIVQDKDGFIWIGTSFGLHRYDGYNFKLYKNIPNMEGTMSDDNIRLLYEDRIGILWIGTSNSGLKKFDKNTERFTNYMHNPNDSTSISGNEILSICMDSEGFLWIGTKGFGLNKFDEKNNKFIHYQHNLIDTNSIIDMTVWAICEDHLKNLWIGTGNGLDRLDRNTGVFRHYLYNPTDKSSLSNNIVQCIFEDKNKTVWIGTAEGLNKLICLNGDDYCFQRYFFNDIKNRNNISWIYQDTSGILFIGTFGEGLFIFDPVTEKFTNYKNNVNNDKSIISDRISRYAMIEDRSGILWIGTRHGISKYNKNKNNFNFYPFKEPIRGWSIFEDNTGNIWITGKENFHIRDSSGIFKIISYKMQYEPFMTTGSGVNGYSDKTGVIWVGYHSVLYNYERIKGELKYFCTLLDTNYLSRPSINIITEDSENLLWVGTSNGLWSIDEGRKNISRYTHDADNPFSLNSNVVVSCIREDENGAIWISLLHNGLDKFDKKTGRFYHYTYDPLDSNSISSNEIPSFYNDGRGNLWIASISGLDKLNLATDTFVHFTEKDGLADRFTLYILPDNSGNLWIATNSGISKFNPSTQIFKNYNKRDGLQSVEFYNIGFGSRKGELFFSGVKGINYFFPDSIKENTHIPPVVITSFKIFGKEAELDKSITKTKVITLTYDENFFSIEFAALEYTNPVKNKYLYKLEGVDNQWLISENRTAYYTNIDPGEYIFRVKGSNNDGVWNEEGTSIRIIITPPWWATWWFRGSCILLLLAVLEFSRERHMTKVRREIRQKEEFSRQLISGQEQERKRIASDLHDSHAQNLLVLKNRVSLLMRRKDTAETAREELRDISEGLLHSMDEIRSISYSLRPHEIERFGLTDSLVQIIEKVSEACSIIFKTQIENINGLLKQDDEVILYRIVQECVNNIIKHSHAKTALIKISKLPDSICIQIKDDGRGFEPESLGQQNKHSLGMTDIRERINLLKGKFDIITSPGKGTSIQLNLPYTAFSSEQ